MALDTPMIASTADPRQNRLLAALPEAEWERWRPQLELIDLPLGTVLYEAGSHAGARLLSDHGDCFVAVRDGRRRVGRNRGRRQRRHSRHLAVHGRCINTQPRRRAKCGHGVSADRDADEGGIRALRPRAASAAALHPGADHSDGADRRLQSASFGRPAVVPMAVTESGSAANQRARP